MKNTIQIIIASFIILFSGLTSAGLISDWLNEMEVDEVDEVAYEIKTLNQHETVLNIFRDIEFKEGVVELDYQEAALEQEKTYIIKAIYLLEKEKLDINKEMIEKIGFKITEEKNYELTMNYIYGYRAYFELKEYKEN
tara:strand:+ start:1234 stop:1647 length:414 start_codon:yes stop_codon:yes gene_type:complete